MNKFDEEEYEGWGYVLMNFPEIVIIILFAIVVAIYLAVTG